MNRHVIVEEDVVWKPKKCKSAQFAEIVVQSPKWNPRLPMKRRQKWDESSRQLIHVGLPVSLRTTHALIWYESTKIMDIII